MSNQLNPISSRPDVVASMRHVTRYFENLGFVRALVNVSLDIPRGEIFGLLGSKGSGKSTALRILAGRLSASDGKVKVFRRSPRRRGVRARIGYLPEETANMDQHIVARMLSFLHQLFEGTKRRKEAVSNHTRPPRKRNAVLAQILAKGPDLILLDEPFSGLDPAGCAELKQLLLALVRRGKTVVLTGDSLCETKDICNRIAVFYAGVLQAVGTLPELLSHPEAIRLTSSLLPPPTAERVLQTISRDLTDADASLFRPTAESAATCVNQDAPLSTITHTAHEILSTLLKSNVCLSVETAPISPVQIDHDKLAKLTKSK